MIISKTPCRISFAGGGSDIPEYYEEFSGAVVSTTIDKYVYVMVTRKFDHRIRVSYSHTEEVDTVEEVDHPIVRECLKLFNSSGGVEITSIADIPSRGTGLGSSSSFAVGLLNSLSAFAGRRASPETLARTASRVEIEICGNPIGKQDQYAAAYGSMNFLIFETGGNVNVTPIVCSSRTLQKLQNNLLVYYTGITRSANEILAEQTATMRDNREARAAMRRMVQLAWSFRNELDGNSVDSVGEILHEGWMMKRSLSRGITNSDIDQCYEVARRAGASGGKLLGAGGGGFLLLYVPKEKQASVTAAMSHLRRLPIKFEREGSKIVFYNPTDLDVSDGIEPVVENRKVLLS